MLYFPDWTGSWAQLVLAAFALTFPLFFVSEATGLASFGYSKFADREARFAIPSRIGMFFIYFPAAIAYPVIHGVGGGPSTPWHLLAMSLVSLHFLKRTAEALFLHRYSGVMNLGSTLVISGLYTTLSAVLGWVATYEIPADLVASAAFQPWIGTGLAVWLLGTAINGYHHVLLRSLRAPGDTGYTVPRGGLFPWVACPHYLGEIVAWIGYALLYHHVGAAILTLTMTAYLMGRSYQTVRWYRDRVEGTPERWKRLIPFVY